MGDNGPCAAALTGQRLSEATHWRSRAGETPKRQNSAKSGLLQTSGISVLVGIEKKIQAKRFLIVLCNFCFRTQSESKSSKRI